MPLLTNNPCRLGQIAEKGCLMSEYIAKLHWSLKDGRLQTGGYDVNHRVRFAGGLEAMMTSAPDYGGDQRYVNPEEAIAASLSSCHMMTFLALCAKAGWKLTAYEDRAVARLGRTHDGKMRVASITLNPKMTFEAGHERPQAELEEMHERAHRYCFVANSLSCEMAIQL